MRRAVCRLVDEDDSLHDAETKVGPATFVIATIADEEIDEWSEQIRPWQPPRESAPPLSGIRARGVLPQNTPGPDHSTLEIRREHLQDVVTALSAQKAAAKPMARVALKRVI